MTNTTPAVLSAFKARGLDDAMVRKSLHIGDDVKLDPANLIVIATEEAINAKAQLAAIQEAQSKAKHVSLFAGIVAFAVSIYIGPWVAFGIHDGGTSFEMALLAGVLAWVLSFVLGYLLLTGLPSLAGWFKTKQAEMAVRHAEKRADRRDAREIKRESREQVKRDIEEARRKRKNPDPVDPAFARALKDNTRTATP